MSINKQQLLRLLDLFPVDLLKEEFDLEGPKEAVLVDAASEELTDIHAFVRANFHVTRQHVFCYENSAGKIPSPHDGPLLTGRLLHESRRNGELVQVYLAEETVEYLVDDGTTISRNTLDLLWPVKVHISPEYFIVRCTVLERDLSAEIRGGKVLGTGKRSRGDDGLLTDISKAVGDPHWTRLDLNKGIKALWDTDDIDAISARAKKARSTSTEEMDEKFTLKKGEPARYREMVSKPLHGCVFLFLKDQSNLGKGFHCNPTEGTMRFTRYCKGNESTDHVIRKILAANI